MARECCVDDIIEIFNSINCINNKLTFLEERRITFPEIVSENIPVFLFKGKYLRTDKAVPGYGKSDLIDLEEKVPVQVKSCTTKGDDCTSFGPNTTQDGYTLFIEFVHPLPDGIFKIFRIENDEINKKNVNKEQTVLDQKVAQRRPRFSLKKHIRENSILPLFQGTLLDLKREGENCVKKN